MPFDRKDKLPVYARAGIVEYWLVNLVEKWWRYTASHRQSAIIANRSASKWRHHRPAAFPDLQIAVADLF